MTWKIVQLLLLCPSAEFRIGQVTSVRKSMSSCQAVCHCALRRMAPPAFLRGAGWVSCRPVHILCGDVEWTFMWWMAYTRFSAVGLGWIWSEVCDTFAWAVMFELQRFVVVKRVCFCNLWFKKCNCFKIQFAIVTTVFVRHLKFINLIPVYLLSEEFKVVSNTEMACFTLFQTH